MLFRRRRRSVATCVFERALLWCGCNPVLRDHAIDKEESIGLGEPAPGPRF
jgi:hypothetical protein